jgi:hypothetical protein
VLLAQRLKGEVMPRYLVAIHHPDNYDPSLEDEAMVAADARIFVGGLRPVSSAKSLRAQSDGKVLITDGPYLETKEHIGGFWVLEAADLDEALAWRRKAAVACRAPVEVRPFEDERYARRQAQIRTNFVLIRRLHEKAQNFRTHLARRRDPGLRR